MEAFVGRERAAWRTLRGCEATPPNPYDDAFFDALFRRVAPPMGERRSWESVASAWANVSLARGGCSSGLILVSIYKSRVAAAVCDHVHARRAQLGALGHLRVFKYILQVG